MADPAADPLRSLSDLAEHLGVGTKAARRCVVRAMASDLGLRVTLVGRSIRFTAAQWERTLKALEWRPVFVGQAPAHVRTTVTSRAGKSAQERVRERLLKKLGRDEPRTGPKR